MVFNETSLNSNWNLKTLEELGLFKRGKSKHRPRNDIKLFENGTIPLVQTGDIKAANIYLYKANEFYNEFGLKQSKLWNEGTLCITIAANIAETAILKEKMCFPDSVVGFIAFDNETTSHYIHYLFSFIRFRIQNSIQGSIQDNINIDYLTKLKFRIPEFSAQQKIASVLSALDDKIELNNRINVELEAMAKTLYDYWFVQFDFPNSPPLEGWQNSKNFDGVVGYKSSGGKMVYNETLKREIPEGWEVTVFNDWIKNTKAGDWGKESIEGNYTERVYCIRGADINGINGKGEVKAPERFILKNNSSKKLVPNDFVVEISGGSPVQSTGRIALITESTLERFDKDIICSNFCKAVSIKDEKYIYNFKQEWQRLYDAGVFFGFEGKTSGIKNFLFDSFMNSYSIVLPQKEIVEKYYEFAKSIDKKIQSNLKQNQELSALRDWLLPMLMNGQVKVREN